MWPALWKLRGKGDGLHVLSSSVGVPAFACSKPGVRTQPVGRGRESWLGGGLKSSILLENNLVFPGGGSLSYVKEKYGNSSWDKPTRRKVCILDIYNIPNISFRNFLKFSGFFLSNDTSRLKYYHHFIDEEIQAHWFHSLAQGKCQDVNPSLSYCREGVLSITPVFPGVTVGLVLGSCLRLQKSEILRRGWGICLSRFFWSPGNFYVQRNQGPDHCTTLPLHAALALAKGLTLERIPSL